MCFSSLSFVVTPFKWENWATISAHFGFSNVNNSLRSTLFTSASKVNFPSTLRICGPEMSTALFEVPNIISMHLNCWRRGRKWKRSRSVGTSGSRIQQCSALNTIHVNCHHRIHHSYSLYARCGHQLVSRCRFVTGRCMMCLAADLVARRAFALSCAVSTSCRIKTQLFQT